VFRTRFRPSRNNSTDAGGAVPDNCSLICFAASREAWLSGQVPSLVAGTVHFSVDSKDHSVRQAYMRSWSKRIAWLCLLLTLNAGSKIASHAAFPRGSTR
jgi:hypothetical protein